MELQEEVSLFNKYVREREKNNLGIGIHIGTLMLGTIGEENHLETTVIADVVNITSRLEELTKIYGARIIISRELLDKLNKYSHLDYRHLGSFKIKGKRKSIEIVEIIDNNPGDKVATVFHKNCIDCQSSQGYHKGYSTDNKKSLGRLADLRRKGKMPHEQKERGTGTENLSLSEILCFP